MRCLDCVLQLHKEQEMSWYKWESINIKKNDKVKQCLSFFQQKTTFELFLKVVVQEMEEFPAQVFRAELQQNQISE